LAVGMMFTGFCQIRLAAIRLEFGAEGRTLTVFIINSLR